MELIRIYTKLAFYAEDAKHFPTLTQDDIDHIDSSAQNAIDTSPLDLQDESPEDFGLRTLEQEHEETYNKLKAIAEVSEKPIIKSKHKVLAHIHEKKGMTITEWTSMYWKIVADAMEPVEEDPTDNTNELEAENTFGSTKTQKKIEIVNAITRAKEICFKNNLNKNWDVATTIIIEIEKAGYRIVRTPKKIVETANEKAMREQRKIHPLDLAHNQENDIYNDPKIV